MIGACFVLFFPSLCFVRISVFTSADSDLFIIHYVQIWEMIYDPGGYVRCPIKSGIQGMHVGVRKTLSPVPNHLQ